ncbi:hypothetical protein ACFL6D_03200 [Spirochaetota bacterium]
MKKLIYISFLLLCMLYISLQGNSTFETVFDTPTPFCYSRGEFSFAFTTYDEGGINVRAIIGINERILLGITEFIDGIIGTGINRWHTPGVLFKMRLLDNPIEGFNLGIGYNPLYNGAFMEYEKRAYGISVVGSKGFFLFGDYPHLLSFGANFPLLPDEARSFSETKLFTSIVFDISEYIDFSTELQNIGFNAGKHHYFIWNNSITFSFSESLNCKFIVQLTDDYYERIENEKFSLRTSRLILISYTGFF